MALYEVVLQATSNDDFSDLTRRFPSSRIFTWCNREHDVMEVIVENPDEYPLVVNEVHRTEIRGIVVESSDNARFCLIVHKCNCMRKDTMVKHIGKLNLLNIFPSITENGWTYNRLIAFRHEDFEELLRRLEKWGWHYNILHKAAFNGFIASSMAPIFDTLFSGLTEKQIDAMLTAYRYGYYNLPRGADVQTIAAKEQVARTTFQEHLKKAENKLVATLVPYIQLFNHAPKDRRESLKIDLQLRDVHLYSARHFRRSRLHR